MCPGMATAADSYLRLVNRAIAEGVDRGTPAARRAFAAACAELALGHLRRCPAASDGFDLARLEALHAHALDTSGTSAAPGVDEALRRLEDELYAAICALRADDAAASYSDYSRLDVRRHVVRVMRALLATESATAAGWAAFEAIAATRDEEAVTDLARRMFAG